MATSGELPDMPGWRPDPKGGFIRIPPPAEPEPEPEALPYGWMEDKDGTGLVRIPDEQLPPPFRPGYWCKIANLSQDTDKNGLIVEVLDTKPDPDIGAVEIRCDTQTFHIKPVHLQPIEGSEKVAEFHKGTPRVSWR